MPGFRAENMLARADSMSYLRPPEHDECSTVGSARLHSSEFTLRRFRPIILLEALMIRITSVACAIVVDAAAIVQLPLALAFARATPAAMPAGLPAGDR